MGIASVVVFVTNYLPVCSTHPPTHLFFYFQTTFPRFHLLTVRVMDYSKAYELAKDAPAVEQFNKNAAIRAIESLSWYTCPRVRAHTTHWWHPKLWRRFVTAPVTLMCVGSGDLPRRMDVCTALHSDKPFSLEVIGNPGSMPSGQNPSTNDYELRPFESQGGLPLLALQFKGFKIAATDPNQIIWCIGELWPSNVRTILATLNNFILDDGNMKLHCMLPHSGATVILGGPDDPGFQ